MCNTTRSRSMIHVVTVPAGSSSYAEIGQRHAMRMAQLFQARLRVAMIWGTEDTEGANAGDVNWEARADKEVERISREAGNSDILVERSLRGEGLLMGLLAEARETDLLVLGLPECPTGDEPVCKAIRHNELPVLHKAECLILVVYRDPAPIQSVLVDYHGGSEGKAALRAAGELAIRASAAVTVLSIDQARDNAGMLAASGKRYLAGFGISAINTIERLGEPDSETEVLHAAESIGADLVVVGGERHGLLGWLLRGVGTHPEEISAALGRPVLIAR